MDSVLNNDCKGAQIAKSKNLVAVKIKEEERKQKRNLCKKKKRTNWDHKLKEACNHWSWDIGGLNPDHRLMDSVLNNDNFGANVHESFGNLLIPLLKEGIKDYHSYKEKLCKTDFGHDLTRLKACFCRVWIYFHPDKNNV